MLPSMHLPVGYTWRIGGQYDSQRNSFRELLPSLRIATSLVFIILVVQFRPVPAGDADHSCGAALARRARSGCCS